MAWLPNPFKSLQLFDDEESYDAGAGSVKKDLSEFGEAIGRQLRSFAAFLAPPPLPQSFPPAVEECSSATRYPRMAGVRNDLAEISDSFKSSLSFLSSNKAVIGIAKLASNFLQLNEEEVEEEVDHDVGITDEVVDFVTEISEQPECWTDFVHSLNDDDFAMSQAQAKHISIIEQLVPSLVDLRITLSNDMRERQFWMIYFILLLPRLNESSLNLLSTPEIVEARSGLLAMLRRKRNLLVPEYEKDETANSSLSDSAFDEKLHGGNASGKAVVDENLEVSTGMQTGRKETTEKCFEEEDENTASVDALRQWQNEDDISLCDLEDDEFFNVSSRRYGPGQGDGSSSSDGSSEWVRLNAESGGRGSPNRDSEGEKSELLDEYC